MAYVINERVKSRRWGRSIKSKVALISLAAILIAVLSMPAHNELIFGIKALHKKAEGQQVQAGGPKKDQSKTSKKSTNGSVAGTNTLASSPDVLTVKCNVSNPQLSNYQDSISPEIQKLSEYEKACGGQFIDSSMLFTNMPKNAGEASALAVDTSRRLKEFAKYNLTPYLILEPLTSSGFIDFKSYAGGAYDEAMDTYFAGLKTQGVTDQSLGVVVPFPESNIPEWGNINPTDVAACITRTVSLQKQHFPNSKASVLLDSKTYPQPDSWDGGAYVSLLPYVSKIPKNLIDSFGLQGYPWPDPEPEHNPARFLSANMAMEAAAALGAKDIWFSSGTFARGKAWNGQTYSLSSVQRSEILAGIVEQGRLAKQAGYIVTLMLFGENKFNTGEGIDWSYWPASGPNNEESSNVLRRFQNNATSNGLSIGVFDS